ncbi:ubiquitin-conjugating enzyme E2 [Pelomyxa schiedti]|nr:ubiquitin-conjugating enzyme E2 [Pelomyxa schiedti]
MSAASRFLTKQLKDLAKDPVEGFCVEVINDNLFEWRIWLEGPSETVYEGAVYELKMTYPADYPMMPPKLKFVSEFWHPNVYKDGKVCISILHPPGEDAMSGELASERWLPTQNVSSIILSVVSMLAAPNFSSPANVDASVEWRNRPDLFEARVKKLVAKANAAKPKGLVIPHPETNPEEKRRNVEKLKEMAKPIDDTDLVYDGPGDVDSDGDSDDDSDDIIVPDVKIEELDSKTTAPTTSTTETTTTTTIDKGKEPADKPVIETASTTKTYAEDPTPTKTSGKVQEDPAKKPKKKGKCLIL